jgi:predicted ATPase/DNA-binding SARP family transcriptional activator
MAHAAATESRIEFRLLGLFEVAAGQRRLKIGSPKQRRLLALLVVNLNRPVPVDVILDVLWPDGPPASAQSTLQSLVSRLRVELGGDRAGGALLRLREAGYVLEADPGQVDANRFEALTGRGRDAGAGGDPGLAAELLGEALGLWRGPALADLADAEPFRPEAARLEEARLGVVEELAEAELARGRPAQALTHLEPHVEANPLRERAWGPRMVALYRLGRQADALRAFQSVRRLLGEELGLEPTPALRRLEQQILRQSPELEGPTVLAAAGRATAETEAFLFTDIEASTRRWEGDQDAMARDLSRHDRLLRQAVEAAAGHVFSHTGDGLCAAFPTASAALAAALAGQQGLLATEWAGPGPLRVRMAVHAGAAERGGGTYLGPTLNRTARLLALAAGGQVLCSQAAAELSRDRLPAGVTLLDLGEHRLADLSRPERVYQLVHPELPAGFAPLRSPVARRHNLPLTLTSFVGRSRELDQLDGLLAGARLLTLTGVGGAGKTRTALELAARNLDRFPDGAWLVELNRVRDPALVTPEVVGALGMLSGAPSQGPAALEEWLGECLLARRMLLILDNCEHLAEAAARLAYLLLSRAPDITILATSREVLGLPGELVLPLGPLSVPPAGASRADQLAGSDAVSLFCERARTAQPGFGLSDANAAAVVQICRRLDGIPLALELAAARLRVLGAQQVAERLDQRFALLTDTGRRAAPRHQTLRAAIDWSYDLLPAAEQAVLRRLSVFPSSFDLEAAEAVAGDVPADPGLGFPVLDLVGRLVEKSLVVAESTGGRVRYRLLETLRDYGADRLAEAGETEPVQRRHRDFFLALADDWWKQSGGAALRIEPWTRGGEVEQDNFRAALDWSLLRSEHGPAARMIGALWLYWWYAGHFDVRDWLERVVAGSAGSDDPLHLHLLVALAIKMEEDGDGQGAVVLAREAMTLGERLGDPDAIALARVILGVRLLSAGHRDEAQQVLETALAESAAAGLSPNVGFAHHDLGWIAMAEGDPVRAKAHFEQALTAVRNEAGSCLKVHCLAALAPVAALTGEPERARTLAAEAVGGARLLQLRRILVMALVRAAETAVLTGDDDEARDLVRELLAHLAEIGSRRWVADAVELAALVLERDGQAQPAARLIGACAAVRSSMGEPAGGLRALAPTVQASQERLVEALGAGRYAEQEALGAGLPAGQAMSYAAEWLEPPEITPRPSSAKG